MGHHHSAQAAAEPPLPMTRRCADGSSCHESSAPRLIMIGAQSIVLQWHARDLTPHAPVALRTLLCPECESGTVDGLVIDFLMRTTFRTGDFIRVSDGTCRLHPQLARAVVASCSVPQARHDEHAHWLALALLAKRTATASARDESEVSGISHATLYCDLNAALHVGKYSDIADAHWTDLAAWFTTRIEAEERRRAR